jgi:hypothetical protein
LQVRTLALNFVKQHLQRPYAAFHVRRDDFPQAPTPQRPLCFALRPSFSRGTCHVPFPRSRTRCFVSARLERQSELGQVAHPNTTPTVELTATQINAYAQKVRQSRGPRRFVGRTLRGSTRMPV